MAIEDAVYTVNELSEFIGKGVKCVKQVARGVHTFTNYANATINTGLTVDPAKTIILLSPPVWVSSGSPNVYQGVAYSSYLVDVAADSFTINACFVQTDASTRILFSTAWQLIEFY